MKWEQHLQENAPPIDLSARCGDMPLGSTQASIRAHGSGRTTCGQQSAKEPFLNEQRRPIRLWDLTSGGSMPILRHVTRPTARVRMRLRCLHC